MDARLPDDDRDLRLARRLDAGEAADGSDRLHEALGALRPEAAADAGAAERMWAGIASRTAPPRPARAADRAPARGLRRVPTRAWALAASVALVAALGVWLWPSGPTLVAEAQGEIVRVATEDGSMITLRPNSRLFRLGEERAYRLEGEAQFAVASDPERPFTVAADIATVRVLGTQFVVSTWGAQTDVFVEEGRVEVSGARSGVVLGAGEAASVTDEVVRTLLEPDPEAATDWLRGEAVFDRVPVARVLDEVGQHFGVAITLPRSAEDQAISGTVPLEDVEQALGEIGRILDGQFVQEAGGYRLVLP